MLLYVDANFASPYALVAFVSLIEKGLDFEIKSLDLAAHANHDANFVMARASSPPTRVTPRSSYTRRH